MIQHRTNLLSSSMFAVGMLGAALLGGCAPVPSQNSTGIGGDTGSTGSGNNQQQQDPQQFFIDKVYPALTACTACHVTGAAGAPIYLGKDGPSSYAKIKTVKEVYKSNSPIPIKGEHAGGAPALKPDQKAIVEEWLKLEFANGNGDNNSTTGGGGQIDENAGKTADGKTMAELVQAWGDCMHRGDWNDDGMQGWSLLQTNGFGPCVGCHELGNAGTFLNDDPDTSFDNNREVPYIYRLVLPKYDKGGQLAGLQGSRRLIDKGKVKFNPNPMDPNYFHPTYNGAALEGALELFQQHTDERIGDDHLCTDPEPRKL